MKAHDLRQKTPDQLRDELIALKKEAFNLRFRQATGQLENTARMNAVRKDKNEQTITVLVERRFKHPLLQKTVRKSKKYRAHDAENKFKVGDTVRIEECAPISKTKRWTVVVEA